MMTDHLGTDIAKISNELSKLMLSLPEGTRAITAAHIEQNIGISKDFNNFELMKAITSRNLSRAMLIADHFARNPKENPLVVTLMAMFREFRQLFTINYLNWQQRTKGIPMPSDQELCRMLGVPAPFLLAEIKQTAARWPNNRVFNILGIIREYDAKCKGIGTGGLNDGELLREMILKILV
jgi:DNA polymerase-3 subunit delta